LGIPALNDVLDAVRAGDEAELGVLLMRAGLSLFSVARRAVAGVISCRPIVTNTR
jgi:hypothetical protein